MQDQGFVIVDVRGPPDERQAVHESKAGILVGELKRQDAAEPVAELPRGRCVAGGTRQTRVVDGYYLRTLFQKTGDGQGIGAAFFNPQIKETARQVCENHKDKFLVGGLGWGLFEISWSLRGFENILMDSVIEPDFYEELLDKLMNLYLAFVDYTCDLPIDAIMFGDDWGDQRGIILGPELWRKFLKPRWAKIYNAVHAKGKYVISHSCGSVVDVIPDLIEMGLDVLESVQPEARGMNPYELKKKFGDKITFWGCLGTQEILPYGTPDDIKKEIKRLCAEMGRGGGFILAPAKPLQPETSAENAAAVVEAFTNQEI